jgi:hypothetical protein
MDCLACDTKTDFAILEQLVAICRQQIRNDQAGVPGLRFRCGRSGSGDLLRRLSFPDIWRVRCMRIRVSGRGISELGHGTETNIDLVKFA